MTYTEAIQKHLKHIDEQLDFPINIVLSSYSANYVSLKTERVIKKKSIDEVLRYQIPNYKHLSIVWSDHNNDVIFKSWEHTAKFESAQTNIQNHLEQYKYVATTKDGKYKIYLLLLPDAIEYEENGFIYEEYLVNNDKEYEFNEVILPTFDQYKYQNLYNYQTKDEFTNAVMIEFIIRNAKFNNLLPAKLECQLNPLESETEEEFEIRVEIEFQNQEKKLNDTLKQNYGLDYEEINTLFDIFDQSYTDRKEDNQLIRLLKYPQPAIRNVEVDYAQSERELLEQIKNNKKVFDDEQATLFNYKTKINSEYLEQAFEVIEKFPTQSFKKRQDSIITALYVYDYVRAAKLDIKKLNQLIEDKYEAKREKIEDHYKQLQASKDNQIKNLLKLKKSVDHLKKEKEKLLKEQEQAFSKHEEELRKELHGDPKVKTDEKKDSIYHDIAYSLETKAGQMKKIHDYIQKFIENKIPQNLSFLS